MKYYIIKLAGTNTDPSSTTYGQPEVRTGIVEAPSFSDAVHRATLIWEHTYFVIDSAYLVNVVDSILYWEAPKE